MLNIENYQFIEKLKNLNFVEEIILFGSRARKDNTARADIDLAINCPQAKEKDWLNILDIIAEADTLLKIDCVRLDQLNDNSELKQNIKRDGVILYAKNSNKVQQA
jgi:uncharacterized protein